MSGVIAKASRLVGRNLYLRNIEESDARFVFDLRKNPEKFRYISPSSDRLQDQVEWINRYKFSDDQAYFIVCEKSGANLGCVRMYDAFGRSYCWGSWIMIRGLSPLALIESMVIILAYGKYLGFTEARMSVRQANLSVWKFHENFSQATFIKEDKINRFYVLKENRIDEILERFNSLLSSPFVVEPI